MSGTEYIGFVWASDDASKIANALKSGGANATFKPSGETKSRTVVQGQDCQLIPVTDPISNVNSVFGVSAVND